MEPVESIEEFMNKDHEEIAKLIEHIDDNVHNEKEIEANLKKLQFHLEEHFLVEEKAVMIEIHDKHKHYPITSSLLLDHEELRKELKRMIEKKSERTVENLKAFLNDLRKHKNKEERLLYPDLDRDLDFKTKQKILKKLAEGVKD